jgi:predicted nuclease of predicted toxin-antitoxin system
MKFLIDESADLRLSAYLQGLGHDVTSVARDYSPSIPDHEVLAIADREERIVITFDRDFGELIFSQHHSHSGVLYFRLGPIDLSTEISRMNHVLTHYSDQLDRFLTITRRSVRVR